jgi:hypothetical protein
MTEIERLEVISGYIAHPEFVDQFRLGAPHVSRRIDSHRNLTSFNRISGIITHCQYDAISNYMTSYWFQNIKPRRNPFVNDRDLNDFAVFTVKMETNQNSEG